MSHRTILKCACLLLAILRTDAAYLCSNAGNDYIVQLADERRCTCAPGYYLPADGTGGISIGAGDIGNAKWTCAACHAGYFKAETGVQACHHCATDYLWSAAGASVCNECAETNMLTPLTRNVACIPCPLDLATLLTYTRSRRIENTPMQLSPTIFIMPNANNMDAFRDKFHINQSLCRSAEMVRNVGHLLVLRTVCALGTYTSPASLALRVDDVDTVCLDCEAGKYNAQTAAHMCTNITRCENALSWDSTGVVFAGRGRTLDSTCTLDWNIDQVQQGRYPVVLGGDVFVFDSHRHVQIGSNYVSCVPDTTLLQTKCNSEPPNVPTSKCRHDFLGAWQRGDLTLSAAANVLCKYRCQTQYVLTNAQCTQCVLGTFKTDSMSEAERCVLCAAGTYMPNTNPRTGCIICPPNTFSSDDRTICHDVCVPNQNYASTHHCWRPRRSYLIILPVEQQKLRINVETCEGGSATEQTRYAGEGEQFCRNARDCQRDEEWIQDQCLPCGLVNRATSFNFRCVPNCEQGYFPSASAAVVSTVLPSGVPFFCKPCEASLEVFQSQGCRETEYLAEQCTVANTNNLCLPCSGLRQMFQERDPSSVLATAFRMQERCIFKCRGAETVQGNLWYYLDVQVVATMMGLTEPELRTRILSEPNQVQCIRSQVHSKFNCLDDNLELIVGFQGAHGELARWPTVRCRGGAQRSCAQKNGVEVRVNNLNDDFQCHCKPGFYGTYQAQTSTLLKCNFCPKYGDSIKGTFDVQGCFCRAGTSRNQNQSLQLVSQGLVCVACDLGNMYCPGGPDIVAVFDYVHQTVARDLAVKIYPSSAVDAGKQLPCPADTSTRHPFASSIGSCIVNNDMRYDVALGHYVYCDDDRHASSPDITQWLEPRSEPCNRRCRPPFSVLQPATGHCRCDAEKGYIMVALADDATLSRRARAVCKCEPGWYRLEGQEACTPCPRNSYCDGETRTPCEVQFASPMYSKMETDCLCPPGFYFQTQSCLLCQRGSKCFGGRQREMQRCSTEEICHQRGMFIPKTCPRGSTKLNVFAVRSNDPVVCYSHGVFVSMHDMPNVHFLYTNHVHRNDTGLVASYNVINSRLVDLCSDSIYREGVLRVLSQVAPVPISGFFGTLQWLCGPERVLVRRHTTSSSQEQPLLDAFECTGTPFATGHGALLGFLMNAGLAVTGLHPMGHEGFISQSYHNEIYSMLDPDSHLLWNIFMACDQLSGTAAAVSEIDTCVMCDITDSAGFLVLGMWDPFSLSRCSECAVVRAKSVRIQMMLSCCCR